MTNLSDKTQKAIFWENGLKVAKNAVKEEDIKKAIKELKEQFPNSHPIEEEIQKIFGNKLTEQENE